MPPPAGDRQVTEPMTERLPIANAGDPDALLLQAHALRSAARGRHRPWEAEAVALNQEAGRLEHEARAALMRDDPDFRELIERLIRQHGFDEPPPPPTATDDTSYWIICECESLTDSGNLRGAAALSAALERGRARVDGENAT